MVTMVQVCRVRQPCCEAATAVSNASSSKSENNLRPPLGITIQLGRVHDQVRQLKLELFLLFLPFLILFRLPCPDPHQFPTKKHGRDRESPSRTGIEGNLGVESFSALVIRAYAFDIKVTCIQHWNLCLEDPRQALHPLTFYTLL